MLLTILSTCADNIMVLKAMNILLVIPLLLLPFFLLVRRRRSPNRLPPGSLGLPIIGQSLGLLRAMRANTAERWVEKRVQKYGPVSKLSLFGTPTAFIYGQAANKFVFTSDGTTLSNQQTQSIRMILGDRCLLEISGEDHKRVRGALVSFLKPECLKMYVGKVEEEIRSHLEMHWEGKQTVTVLPLMKTLTFNIICSILFGIKSRPRRDQFIQYFQKMIQGVWSIPINLPFTRFNTSLNASTKARKMVKELMMEKRVELEKGASSDQDLITCLLSIQQEDGKTKISDDEIIDNVVLIMVAGHDTSSVLITFMIRILAKNPTVCEFILKATKRFCPFQYTAFLEQEEIAKNKQPGESLTWEDLAKMKYTWRVAMETMRIFPPIFAGFRKTVKDVEFGGYLIPKGWQIFWVTAMTHMDDSIFQDPTKFDPSRFENTSSIPPYCYIPFGGGPRICPGYEFARIETLVTMHYLVTQYKWKLCCSDDHFSRDPKPVPKQGLPIKIMPRKLL